MQIRVIGAPTTNEQQESAISAYLAEHVPGLSIYVAEYNATGEIINLIAL